MIDQKLDQKQTKYIFVTGGVVSGLGKGITAASIGLILKSNHKTVDAIKFDPYLNVDPGTMSPFEHGEVFVLGDGSECDLDLGHYERFLDTNLTSISSVTAGKIYSQILEKERRGDFLGKNVQLIPHITNHIKDCFVRNRDNINIRIIEIGGSAGDMEGEIFLEAIRQFKQQFKQNNKDSVLHIHLGYVPFLGCSGEYKTKPFQNSLRELQRTGLQPDVLVARYELHNETGLEQEQLDKLALFGNVEPNCVVPVPDLDSIYAVPNHFYKSGMMTRLSQFVETDLNQPLPEFFIKEGKVNNDKKIKIAVVGKYGSKLGDADYSVMQSLQIAGFYGECKVEPVIIAADKLFDKDTESWDLLTQADGVLVLGGFGKRGMEGKILAIEHARINKKPFMGICLGLQMAVVEFARNVCGLEAISAEMLDDNNLEKELNNKSVVIDFMKGQQNIQKKGGTMRLGNYTCDLESGSLASQLFGISQITERHRHRLEVQTKYLDLLQSKGMLVTGRFNYKDESGQEKFLPEIIELDRDIHPYFIATQSHPEMLSRPTKPHPMFLGLVQNCIKTQGKTL